MTADATASYALRPEDRPLLDAALQLGDVLAACGQLDEEQLTAVQTLQQALRQLPAPPAPLDNGAEFEAEYSLTLVRGESVIAAKEGRQPWALAQGRIDTWGVSLNPYGLAVYSLHTPVPAPDTLDDPAGIANAPHELDFFLCPDGSPSAGTEGFDHFINEISALPALLRAPDSKAEANANLGPLEEPGS